jgi:multiple sugar transport system ATP-binding protein
MVLVGPSGCGKTTALRMLAGLEEISGGEIRIGDRVVNDLTPKDRDIAMVFQSYALYPHMSVYDNLAFGLKLRKTSKREIDERVRRAAKILQIDEFLTRKPRALSGGQRQRVAMGRAIVREPQAFLMDEPLSNLDAKLRVQMRAEIAKLQRRLGATTIYVTHDQTEAMTMGDRVAVVRGGRLQQCAGPQELYDRPANLFVASFIGSPAMNFAQAEVVAGPACRVGETTLPLPERYAPLGGYEGRAVALGIRPEHVSRATDADALRLTARVVLTEALGSSLLVHTELRGRPLSSDDVLESLDESLSRDEGTVDVLASLASDDPAQVGETIELALDPRRLHFFDLETGAAIR